MSSVLFFDNAAGTPAGPHARTQRPPDARMATQNI